MLDWENAGKMNLLNVGYPLRAPELLFKKVEDEQVTAQVEKLKNNLKQSAMEQAAQQPQATAAEEANTFPQAQKPDITIDDFNKIDLRVGTILHAEKVEKADKLLKLEIDLGYEKRTVLSGIAMHFKPEEIIGKQVTVVANLALRKMRGIESKGMILMAEDKDGKLVFVPPVHDTDNGSTVK